MIIALKDFYNISTGFIKVCSECGVSRCINIEDIPVKGSNKRSFASCIVLNNSQKCCLCTEPKGGYCEYCQSRV